MKTTGPERSVLVCIRNRCQKCLSNTIGKHVPDDCPFAILHAFPTAEEGIKEMARRTGKTTKLVSLANEIADVFGPVVAFIVPTRNQAESLHRFYKLSNDVFTETTGGYGSDLRPECRNLRGRDVRFFLFDEVYPLVAERVMSLFPWARMVAAYHTPF